MPLFLFLREYWSTTFEEHLLTYRRDQNRKLHHSCSIHLIYHPWQRNLSLSNYTWYAEYHFVLVSSLANRVVSRFHQIHLTLSWAKEGRLPGCTSDFLLVLFLFWAAIRFRLTFGTELCCSYDVVVSRQSTFQRDQRQKLPRPGKRQSLNQWTNTVNKLSPNVAQNSLNMWVRDAKENYFVS